MLTNGYKLYASCRGTHAFIETARKLYPRIPLASKFSIPHCITLALCGYALTDKDFTQATIDDPAARALLPLLEIEPVDGQYASAALIDVWLSDGSVLHAHTDVYRGHAQNPLSDDELRTKFDVLTAPIIGAQRSAELYDAAVNFERPGNLARITGLLAGEN
ncbi:MmgE/PrpD family protein [Enterobacter sp. Bisph1]|uniref:MmgE/PrpD family protein n=1 Tax=Enterobacter sp. Bisph1 TaxID=1274399 RepID=UPI00068B86BE|nr:MmgE/PrpD family protein [Enterobacter sp. Bisph1]